MSSVERWLGRFVPATPQERAAALWSFAYFFTLLAGYYVLRPLRDQMGIAGGVKNLPWLFTATFATLLIAQPLYGALVARLPRAFFIPIVYHFFVANLALFWLLLTFDVEKEIVARVFFVWVSVFNLFAVAVFWSFMEGIHSNSLRSRQLYPKPWHSIPQRRASEWALLYGSYLVALGCGTSLAVEQPSLRVWLKGGCYLST